MAEFVQDIGPKRNGRRSRRKNGWRRPEPHWEVCPRILRIGEAQLNFNKKPFRPSPRASERGHSTLSQILILPKG